MDGDQGTYLPAPLPLEEAEFTRLARESYEASTNYFDSSVRKLILDDLRQFQGLFPTGSKYLSDAYRARSKFFRPKTRSAVRRNEAVAAEAFFQTQDVVSVTAHDPDNPVQLASAEINKALLEYRLTKSIPWFLTLVGAYQDAQVQGIVCSYQHWEYDERRKIDRPCVKLRPIENIRFDPAADWYDPVGTSPYFIELIPMYVKDIRGRMKPKPDAVEPTWRFYPDGEIMKYTTQQSDVVRLQREQGRVDPRVNANSAVQSYAIAWVHRNIVDIDGQDYIYHTLGPDLLLETPRPIEQVYFTGKRPYVIGFSVIETHRNYPAGSVRLTKDIQAELNENANQRLDNVKFAMNKRYFVRRTGRVDLRSLQRNVPSSSTLMDDIEKDVRVVDTPDVTGSAYHEQDRLNLDFDELSGSFSPASVQSNRKLNETVGGMNILTKDASQLSGYQLRTFTETWVEPVLRQLLLLEQRYEDDETIIALAARKAQLYQRFGVNVVTDRLLMQELTITVNVGVGATNPHDQLNNFMLAMRSLGEILKDGTLVNYGVDVAEVIHEIFGKLGYKDGDRFFPEQDGQIAALMGEIKRLQQALAAKQPPEVVAAQVDKIRAEIGKIKADTVKSGVDSAFSAIQTGEVIAAVPQVAPVADEVMRVAGYQPQPGVDPNLPQPPGQGALNVMPITNKRSGIGFTPGAAATGAAQNTSPNFPPRAPGPAQGIETMRAEG